MSRTNADTNGKGELNVVQQVATDLLSRKQAATYLGVSDITLAIWWSTRRYNLQVYKIGRLAKYKKSDLDAFIASGRQA